jgi:hypothetical protein
MTKRMQIMNLQAVILVLLVVVACNLSIPGCTPDNQPGDGQDTTITPLDSPQLPARGYYKGILPIPADGQDLDDSYRQAAQYAEFAPVWGSGIGSSGFWDYAEKLSGFGSTIVDQLIRGNGMFPIIHFSFIDKDPQTGLLILKTPPGEEDATLSDPDWRKAYRQAVIDATKASKPLYLSVGNEVNRWYEQYGSAEGNANGYQHFVSLYEEIYDAVKELSPETKVFCVFAREIVDELREADLDMLNLFDPAKLDIIVFTTYPNSVRKDTAGGLLENPHNRPADIPDDYYSRIFNHMPNKPFGFSEIAWPSTDFYGGEQGQAEFITEVLERLTADQGMNLHLFGWPWLHDVTANDDSGLIRRDGTEKAAYKVWKDL